MQRVLHVTGHSASGLKPQQGLLERLALRGGGRVQEIMSAPADTMHLFADVGELEIDGERANQRLSFVQGYGAHDFQYPGLDCGRTGGTHGLAERSQLFLSAKDRRPSFLNDHLAEQVAKQANVAAKGSA